MRENCWCGVTFVVVVAMTTIAKHWCVPNNTNGCFLKCHYRFFFNHQLYCCHWWAQEYRWFFETHLVMVTRAHWQLVEKVANMSFVFHQWDSLQHSNCTVSFELSPTHIGIPPLSLSHHRTRSVLPFTFRTKCSASPTKELDLSGRTK